MKILNEREQLQNKVQHLYELLSVVESDKNYTHKKMSNAFRNKTVLLWKLKYNNYSLIHKELQEYINELSSRVSEIDKATKREKELLLS